MGSDTPQRGQGNTVPFRLPQQGAQTRQGQAALQQLPVAGNNAMRLPGQTTPGSAAQGGPMLRLAQGQGSAILQTPQALGGSAQQAPAAQGGVGVLTPPGQGGAAVPGQQTQSGPAALQPQQGQQTQGSIALLEKEAEQAVRTAQIKRMQNLLQQSNESGNIRQLRKDFKRINKAFDQASTETVQLDDGRYMQLPRYDFPSDKDGSFAEYQQYANWLGENMPEGGYQKFLEIKKAQGEEWTNLRVNYWCDVAMKRIMITQADTVAFHKPSEITAEYLESANGLDDAQKDGLYHYTCYQEGVRMNKFLGNVPGIYLTQQEMQNLENTRRALAAMCLPYNTILWRGTEAYLLKGLERLDRSDLASWRGETVSMDGNCSTSILPGSAYNKPVQMIIVAPGNMYGAGYINEISYNKAHEGMKSGQYVLQQEYEVLLQRGSRFVIIDAAEVGGKLMLVVKWTGGNNGTI